MSEPTQAQVLKPCPFCGGQAYKTESVNGSNMVYVGCGPCGVHFKAQKDGTNGVLSKDVVAYWNTRAAERSLAPATPTREELLQRIRKAIQTVEVSERSPSGASIGVEYRSTFSVLDLLHLCDFVDSAATPPATQTGDVLREHLYDSTMGRCRCGRGFTYNTWIEHVSPLLAASAAPTPEPTGAEPYIPNFGDLKECVCGHIYYRHFDTYEHMRPVGCKYCECAKFALAAQPGQHVGLPMGIDRSTWPGQKGERKC